MTKKILWYGVLAGVIILISNLVVGQVFQMLFPAIQAEYMSGLFRPWSDPRMMLFFLYPFIFGVILAFIWDKVKSLFAEGSLLRRGKLFGFSVWVAVTLPGMFVTYTSFTVSLALVLSWTIGALVGLVLAGVLLAKLNPR